MPVQHLEVTVVFPSEESKHVGMDDVWPPDHNGDREATSVWVALSEGETCWNPTDQLVPLQGPGLWRVRIDNSGSSSVGRIV